MKKLTVYIREKNKLKEIKKFFGVPEIIDKEEYVVFEKLTNYRYNCRILDNGTIYKSNKKTYKIKEAKEYSESIDIYLDATIIKTKMSDEQIYCRNYVTMCDYNRELDSMRKKLLENNCYMDYLKNKNKDIDKLDNEQIKTEFKIFVNELFKYYSGFYNGEYDCQYEDFEVKRYMDRSENNRIYYPYDSLYNRFYRIQHSRSDYFYKTKSECGEKSWWYITFVDFSHKKLSNIGIITDEDHKSSHVFLPMDESFKNFALLIYSRDGEKTICERLNKNDWNLEEL